MGGALMGYMHDVRAAQEEGRRRREDARLERAREDRIRAGLPQPGTRIKLLGHTDVFSDLRPGELGTVTFIDAVLTVHVDWDCGSRLGLVYGQDRWQVIIG